MSEPKIDLTEIFTELDAMQKNRAWIPTEEQEQIVRHGRPDVSYAKIAQVINKHFGTKITDSQIKYYCDNHSIG